MKFFKLLLLLLIFSVGISCKTKQKVLSKPIIDNTKNTVDINKRVFNVDFKNEKIGRFSKRKLQKKTGDLTWRKVENRGEIVMDVERGHVLMVTYPKGSFGPHQGGIQFMKTIPESDEYYLDYYLKFEKGFDFVAGGKLPGLTSGGGKYTGGNHPYNGEGWSARYAWQRKGGIVVYFYHMGMKENWGDAIHIDAFLKPGKWYRLTQHIKLNDDDKFNGVMEVWLNGEKLVNKKDVRYRLAPLGKIDSFAFSTFHGGNSPKWAPSVDSYIYFDDIQITLEKPEGLE